jgi:hypothetical protein
VTSLARRLERYFEFEELGANWRTEFLAGLTTFITMAYIVFVNPSILAETGMPQAAVLPATCISAAFGSILMGAFARYPIALAPGEWKDRLGSDRQSNGMPLCPNCHTVFDESLRPRLYMALVE